MSTFPQAERRLDDEKDQLRIHGPFPILCRFFAFHKATISTKIDKRDVSYPRVISFVCTQWRAVAHDTPSVWSYLSITDDSTLDNISLSLQHSKSYPLSIRVTVLSQMTQRERLQIQVDRMKSEMERRMDRPKILLASFGSDLELEPVVVETLDWDPLAQFKEKMSRLLQHADRWRVFHIDAAQPLFINCTTALFAQGDRDVPLLKDFRLKTSQSRQEMSRVPSGERTPPFSRATPSLQRLTLCCGILPVEFGPYSSLSHSIFPGLRQLELCKMGRLDRSLYFGILRGLPKFTCSQGHRCPI